MNVTDNDLEKIEIGKGRMTFVNENRQHELLYCLRRHLLHSKRTSGGSTLNAILAIAQFGGQTFYSCQVGNDDNGRFYLQDLQTAGIDYHHNENHDDEGTTGTCLILTTPDRKHTHCIFVGVNEIQSEYDILSDIVVASDYVYFEAYMVTSISTFTNIIRLCEIARVNNVKIAMKFSDSDIIMNYHDRLCEILKNPIDLLFCNRTEAISWCQTDEIDIVVDKLKLISRTFVITRGVKGALVYDGIQLHDIASQEVDAIDIKGAGDMFAGAFLFGITHAQDYLSAGHLANLAAATVILNHGSRLSIDKQKQILVQNNHLQKTT
ncbi:unnamed protein product [Adineta ricciae]|uniref:Carbohydrate kinase PfkB domain-containing protein n=1 Tax=Adineta ricciae TaxID=249248 RepID=A0A815EDI5_ADIRI|nr:unnamed protein product [Adineta ricciae]